MNYKYRSRHLLEAVKEKDRMHIIGLINPPTGMCVQPFGGAYMVFHCSRGEPVFAAGIAEAVELLDIRIDAEIAQLAEEAGTADTVEDALRATAEASNDRPAVDPANETMTDDLAEQRPGTDRWNEAIAETDDPQTVVSRGVSDGEQPPYNQPLSGTDHAPCKDGNHD